MFDQSLNLWITDLDCVEDKLLATVLAGLRAFGTLSHAVLGKEAAHHPRATLIFTIHALLRTDSLVVLRKMDKQE